MNAFKEDAGAIFHSGTQWPDRGFFQNGKWLENSLLKSQTGMRTINLGDLYPSRVSVDFPIFCLTHRNICSLVGAGNGFQSGMTKTDFTILIHFTGRLKIPK
jgi:hypothetical protein